jgi:membrane associated rhomboid family serine protease
MHGSLAHLFFNMLPLWMFGGMLENVWGSKRFLIFYVLCGLGAAILHLAVLYAELTPIYAELQQAGSQIGESDYYTGLYYQVNTPTVGASGAVFGCLAAFGYLFPNSLVLYFFIPMKAKWFVLMYAGIELWYGVRNSAGDNVAHWAHLGGALVGFLLVLYWNKRNRRHFY